MGKPTDAPTQAGFIEHFRAQHLADLDDNGHWVRNNRLTGERLRQRIDDLKIPYTRMALWLGLSIDGLQKQMRGERPVTPQTSLLFHAIEAELQQLKKVEEAVATDTNPQRWRARLKQLVRELQRMRTVQLSAVAHRHRP